MPFIIAPKLPGGFLPAINEGLKMPKVTLFFKHHSFKYSSACILLREYGFEPFNG